MAATSTSSLILPLAAAVVWAAWLNREQHNLTFHNNLDDLASGYNINILAFKLKRVQIDSNQSVTNEVNNQ